MSTPKQEVKTELHPRNRHNKGYDFELLIKASPDLKPHVQPNKYGNESVDFFDPEAVKALNNALLKAHYDIEYWDIPDGFLCPPIPGRADYIHYLADLIAHSNNSKIPTGQKVNCLDIGVGANCIYPIIGAKEYDWKFVGTDIEKVSVDHAKSIVDKNEKLKSQVDIRLQPDSESIFEGIVGEDDYFDLTICNPPFHSSAQEAEEASNRKLRNLKGSQDVEKVSNFGGVNSELWCEGGELSFISNMIEESEECARNVLWFTSLVSKEANIEALEEKLRSTRQKVADYKVIPMGQGNKKSRIIAWTYFRLRYRKAWCQMRLNELG